ncbi:heme-thiolate peroxidase aromatic peroxygenase [Coniophora puteana RWD-64-598 SS2]|uniref:Heme-thiolate peroxidase aromatic peroxygenase n=1 Tax=Coniophora puteana (strain RWD-64-598) TaxID=741705 RepID=A0A5M3MK94_CONPW|nr:heme-thiolate peroxidase aromatic peroxygenase [Coniophora puteana RWD-64-598 SS2]EIW79642.1 heme-thiolate peroxidase aromatic peroxygenase [Coniophora puteana RWD-64-598 SS2]
MPGVLTKISVPFVDLSIFTWDFFLALLNLFSRKRKVGHVTPEGHPGYRGHWPEWKAARPEDSRCSCPALNAMANHGIIARSGKNISFIEMNHQIRATYNFAASFCSFVPHFAARMLDKSYNKDNFDLHDLDKHNGIEHDNSITRRDLHFQPDQWIKHQPFIDELLDSASGKDKDGHTLLTVEDIAKFAGRRRLQAKTHNPNYTRSLFHDVFGSSNNATLLTIFGGRVDDLRTILHEERLPEGWESRIRKPHGLTIAAFNASVLAVERGTRRVEAELRKKHKEGGTKIEVDHHDELAAAK